MKAFNVVRFRVKPGEEARFLDAHRNAHPDFAGYRGGAIIKTGDRSYCFIGGWDDFDSLVAARPQMIAMLDTFRDALEDLGGTLGVSDPVSGETVVELPARTARRRVDAFTARVSRGPSLPDPRPPRRSNRRTRATRHLASERCERRRTSARIRRVSSRSTPARALPLARGIPPA